jgi:hypothetical protein
MAPPDVAPSVTKCAIIALSVSQATWAEEGSEGGKAREIAGRGKREPPRHASLDCALVRGRRTHKAIVFERRDESPLSAGDRRPGCWTTEHRGFLVCWQRHPIVGGELSNTDFAEDERLVS